MSQIKITQLTDIGSNISVTTLVPVVDMSGPTTEKATLGNLGNVILGQAGGNYVAANRANLSYSVVNAAQPNITSVGTLTTLTVSGNTNLGAIGNVRITGGSSGQILSTDGAGNLSWTSDSTGNGTGNVTFSNTTITTSISNGNITLQSNNQGNVYINANSNQWNFSSNGALIFPSNAAIQASLGNANITFLYNSTGISVGTSSGNIVNIANGNISISANAVSHWHFNGNAILEFPDGTTVGNVGGNGTFGFSTNPYTDFLISTSDNATFSWSFTQIGNLVVPGDIVPDANITYSLGNNTNRFKDLYLSNSTIYIGNASISEGAGNTITLSGPVETSNINPIANSNLVITTSSGNNYSWQFTNDGNLLTPGSVSTTVDFITPTVYIDGGNSIITTTDQLTDVTIDAAYSGLAYITVPAADDGTLFIVNDHPNSAGVVLQAGGDPLTYLANSLSVPGSITSEFITANGNLTAGNIFVSNISGNTNGYTIGYLDIPQVSASNTTLGLTDAGKHYYSTTAGDLTLTIPNNTTTSFATGTAIDIVVQAAGNVLVNAASGVTLYMAGNSTAANRYVGAYGVATLLKVATDTWFISGTGVV